MNDYDQYSIHGVFYYHGSFSELFVEVKSGKIASISKNSHSNPVVNLTGAVFPGSVDPHVHFRDPGETWKEDFVSGSMSAVFGGTTCVIDMPNNTIPVDNYDAYSSKLGSLQHRSYADFALASMFTGSNSNIIHPESTLIKVFLGGSTNSIEVSEFNSREVENLNALKSPCVFHMELGSCLKENAMTEENLQDHEKARPETCELRAADLAKDLQLRRKIGAHRSLYHAGMRDGFEALEVTPHHLLLNCEMDLGSEGKVNPPLRPKDTQQTLLQAYVDGKFDFVGSDHAPHSDADKEEFSVAKSGLIGVETRVPLMAALMSKKILSVDVFAHTLFERPAEIYGFKKGRIEIGFDADFIVFDLKEMQKVNEDRLHSKRTVSPFNGFDAIFPRDVFIRGRRLIEDFELVDDLIGSYIPFRNVSQSRGP